MNTVRNLISELREKRLWPVAAALIIALVAVPVLLSSSGKTVAVSPTPVTGSASTPTPALPAVSVTTTPSDARLTGPERDPFSQQVKASSGTTGSSTGTSSTAATGSSSSTGSSGSTSSGGTGAATTTTATSTTTTSTTTSVTEPPVKYLYFEVSVVYGGSGSVPRTLDNVTRLTPLPRASDPLIVYLGVEKDKKTAMFLVSQIVHPTGQGKCLPNRSDCQFLDMKAGEADLFKVVRPSGTVEFTVSLTAVKTVSTTSPIAAAAYARESKGGSKIIARATAQSIALHALIYSRQTGTLSVHLSRRSFDHLLSTLGAPAALGVTLQPFPAGS